MLYAYAEWQFRRGRRLGDGSTEGDNKDSVVRQQSKFFGKKKEEARKTFEGPPEFPEPLRYLWSWFQEISLGIASNGMSYPVITWRDLEAWSNLTGQELQPREARNIIGLGNLRANIMSEKPKTDAGKN